MGRTISQSERDAIITRKYGPRGTLTRDAYERDVRAAQGGAIESGWAKKVIECGVKMWCAGATCQCGEHQ